MATDIIAKMAAEATTKATAKLAEIELAAKYVAHLMEALHGERCRIDISHKHGHVLVVTRLG
ncbi:MULTISPECIES: hypothetical protein [Mesorhizobium]|uniref:Uncharacterized protein n=1 Tax=Mesorhizobium shonense TaxID=1209948 RepID=A0ABV2HQV5_9HYPH|nr:hypothetical protein [Mesorhizobium sp.]RWD99226.1 MAG: hypothetical protein EOS40_20555 [Mesorhizobium sp.]TIT97659.1 MAG: hypothetical protein E5W55_08400 [Mesorhizobium sp.]